MKKKHFFFDLDNTLTPSRRPMDPSMKALLMSRPEDLVVVSAQKYPQMCAQLDGVKAYGLAQNGNDAYTIDGIRLWQNELTEHEKEAINMHIRRLQEHFDGETDLPWEKLVEDRVCEVSYAVLGIETDSEQKMAFDPDGSRREKALDLHPFVSDTLEVSIGGNTTFDYYQKGMHKGKNIMRFLAHMGWDPECAIYFGDRFHPGGNDAPVIGVIETVSVENPEQTYTKLKEILNV